MMGKALAADFVKIRGKGIWFLVILGPVGILAMQALNFGVRYDYMTTKYADNLWGVLLENIFMFVPISLFLGITLVCSLLANIEHHTSSWKLLLALPISRTAVFGAKFALSVLLLTFSCVLLTVGTLVLGLSLNFGTDFPLGDLLRLSFYPFAASLPVLALSLWLCLTFKNQALPITLGVIIALTSMFSQSLTEWIPISWPALAYLGSDPKWFIGGGLLFGIVILLLGTLHFERKDVS